MKQAVRIILAVCFLVLIGVNSSYSSSDIDDKPINYQVLIPDTIEFYGEHDTNNFNDYKFYQVGIKLIYHMKKNPENKLIINNVDDLHIINKDVTKK